MQYKDELGTVLGSLFHTPGFFLEVGCWDGVHFSQTFHLEQQGWKGLCVDPFPQNFSERTCDLCVKAISTDGLPREFVRVTVDRRHGGDVSYFSGFRDSIGYHWNTIEQYCEYTVLPIETITIEQLYVQYSLPEYIEFLSIDVEGAELEIFSGIDLERYRFGLIVFEHNFNENVRRHIGSLLERNGYIYFCQTEIDDMYIWRQLQWTQRIGNG